MRTNKGFVHDYNVYTDQRVVQDVLGSSGSANNKRVQRLASPMRVSGEPVAGGGCCWNPQISLTGIRRIIIHIPKKITILNILIVIFIRHYKIYNNNHITSKVYFTYTTPLLQLVQFPRGGLPTYI